MNDATPKLVLASLVTISLFGGCKGTDDDAKQAAIQQGHETDINAANQEQLRQNLDAGVTPSNLQNAYRLHCESEFLTNHVKVLCKATLNQDGSKLLGELSWIVRPSPKSEDILYLRPMTAFSDWSVGLVLSEDYYHNYFQSIHMVLAGEIQAETNQEDFYEGASLPELPYQGHHATDREDFVITDESLNLDHSGLGPEVHGGSIPWDKIYYHETEQKLFTNALTYTSNGSSAADICDNLPPVNHWPGTWRLPLRSEGHQLFAAGASQLEGYSGWFWHRVSREQSGLVAYQISNDSTFDFGGSAHTQLGTYCIYEIDPGS
ncbi:hypothetical protein [Pseudobacteriovorax antillogorgiicola]|uniref:Uncharacterized protein n=1 Tax=Pseudobacteriovorax antillogorgiicola TaxID=1513793 RepID=A0A1Y6BXR9_9BACT|nr:hypothetical protein [Pseudobacteriovorax antillogorgiicola]TCS53035.1 hypothetical protein EDD56_10886 [Pseudobacteriovorax antillogorgiicola]SMF26574.1 hypothetical protein SAMN06296036_108161 [Pseudobacteriovorax antillogorgiicola]